MVRPGRNVVEKPKPEFKPMKFKSSLPDGFVARQKKVKDIALEHYLQVECISIVIITSCSCGSCA